MIKRTLYFGNPAYLKTANEQLVIEMHDPAVSGEVKTTPITGYCPTDSRPSSITITQALIAKLLHNNDTDHLRCPCC